MSSLSEECLSEASSIVGNFPLSKNICKVSTLNEYMHYCQMQGWDEVVASFVVVAKVVADDQDDGVVDIELGDVPVSEFQFEPYQHEGNLGSAVEEVDGEVVGRIVGMVVDKVVDGVVVVAEVVQIHFHLI